MKKKLLLLGAALILCALSSCSKTDVPPIRSGDAVTIPTSSRPRPIAQAPTLPLPPPDSCVDSQQ